MKKRILFIMQKNFLHPITKECRYNTGNLVFITSGMSMFYDKDIDSKFIPKNEVINNLVKDKNWAKNNFDIAITMEANIFSCDNNETLLNEAKLIKMLKIPTFILGAGCQSDINFSLDFLKIISENAKQYIDTIRNSGGEVTLRGEFSKYALETLGYNDLFVSGCPSLFLKADSFNISNFKTSRKDFKPALNGYQVSCINSKIYDTYKNSEFFDQDMYLKSLYEPDSVKDIYDKKFNAPFQELYTSNRIKGALNYYVWDKQIKEGNFSFSYGSRIHGNIIALQNEIPSFVKVIDSRTRELVEFYKIPNSIEIPFNEEKDDLYDLYTMVNYDNFNHNIKIKRENFKQFLEKYDIPNCLDNNKGYIKHLSTLKYIELNNNVYSNRKNLLRKLEQKKNINMIIKNKLKKVFYKIIYKFTQKDIYYKKYQKYKHR